MRRSPMPTELVRRLAPFEAILAMRERTAFPRSVLEQLPKLRLLITTGMWNASIDIDAATELGIQVCGTQGCRTSDGRAHVGPDLGAGAPDLA